MRIVNFIKSGEVRLGFLVDDHIIDAQSAAQAKGHANASWFADTISFIRSGDEGLNAAKALIGDASTARMPLSEVRTTAPMRPSTLLCSGSNYRAHNAEKANAPISGKEPEFFVMTGD